MAEKSVDTPFLLLEILQKLDIIVKDTKSTKQQLDTRLRCVEDQISGIIRKEDYGCAERLDVRFREKVGREGTRQTQSVVDDNQMNELREEVAGLALQPPARRKESGRSGVTKSSSFNGQPRRKPRRTVNRHTVPSDKDESCRINKFRSECLAKSIQWHTVELIQATSKHKLTLPNWIKMQDKQFIEQVSGTSNQMRILLCHLQKKDFDTMQQWLNHSGIEESVIIKIWETYEEFSDNETNKQKMKCFYCRLTEVDIEHVIDHLYSAEVIGKDLYMQVIQSKPPVGAQAAVWRDVLKVCRDHVRPQTAVWALRIALSDAVGKLSETEQESLREVYEAMPESREDLFQCQCLVICSSHLHPFSCVRSLADVYISPRTATKRESPGMSEDSSSPASTTSSSQSSLDSSGKSSEGLHFDANRHALNTNEETFPKTIDIFVKRPEAVQDRQLDVKSGTRSRRKRMEERKFSKEASSEETNESADGDRKVEVARRNKASMGMSSKPVIYGQNIYLHSTVITNVNNKKTGDSSSDS